jgi:glycerol-3-phosphate dehydrogenase
VEDVLMRRTRLFIEAADGGAGATADVAAIMGRLLGWSRRRRAAEIRRYLDLLEAERVVPAAAAVSAPAAGALTASEPVLGVSGVSGVSGSLAAAR